LFACLADCRFKPALPSKFDRMDQMDTQSAHQRLHALIVGFQRSAQERLIPPTTAEVGFAFEALEGRMTLSAMGVESASPQPAVFMAHTPRGESVLAAPAGVTASDGEYATMIRVKWTAVPGATSYEVWRSETNKPATAERVATVKETVYENTAVEPCRTYFYWVKAKNDAGESRFSVGDVGYRTCPLVLPSVLSVPGTPEGVVASAGMFSTQVSVTWSPVKNAASYEVWRGTTTDHASAVKQSEVTANVYDDTGVRPMRQYFYWVRAKNSGGVGGFSAGVSGWKA
jgi:fibronectin type 3 domain-containing protein